MPWQRWQQEQGLNAADAPVSGGTAAADAGTLAFMVGCEADIFNAVQTALEPMSKATLHAGASGAGQVAKICNNMLLAITMIGTCEAFTMAEKLGLDAQNFFDISSQASGQSWSMTSYCPVPGPVPASPANNDYKPGFAGAMMFERFTLGDGSSTPANAAETPLGRFVICMKTFARKAVMLKIFLRLLKRCNSNNRKNDFMAISRHKKAPSSNKLGLFLGQTLIDKI